MSELTHKQRLFLVEYLGRANGNATEAARLAGYATPHPEGSRLLRNATIQEAIRQFYADYAMPAEEILGRLADQARGPAAYINTDGIHAFIDLDAMTKANKLHLVKSIKNTEQGQTIEFYDAQAALQLLGRNQRLFVDKTDLAVSGGLKVTSETTILELGPDDVDRDPATAEGAETCEPG